MIQELYSNVDLVEQKRFDPYQYISCSKKFREEWSIYVSKVWNAFQMKTMKDYRNLYLKIVLLLADVFEKLRKISLTIMGYPLVIIWAHQL